MGSFGTLDNKNGKSLKDRGVSLLGYNHIILRRTLSSALSIADMITSMSSFVAINAGARQSVLLNW